MLAAAACGAPANYSTADEDSQQQYLDRFAKGFEQGFKMTARGQAEIENISTNAQYDSVSVDIRFLPSNVERATTQELVAFRKIIFEKNCNFGPQRALFEQGVTLKVRMKKPSGSALASYDLNKSSCASHFKKV